MNAPSTPAPTFEVWQGADKKYRAQLRSNRNTVPVGISYPLRADAIGAIEKLKATTADTPIRFLEGPP